MIKNYYRDSLHIQHFKPINKNIFPLPPSGWCSWYYYYQEINEDEVKRNANWVAKNLKEYGADLIQIDDGWQGVGHGNNDNRDWTTIDKRFPNGMDKLASYIKNLGMKPGLWLAPHGQSNDSLVHANKNVFLLKNNDSTLSNTWEGKYLVDPSTNESQTYFKNLFATLLRWGYDYFKIDGQPIVVNEYKKYSSQMKNATKEPIELYRKTLNTIRETIGEKRYLLGCWGIPLDGIGIMNGSRTGGDIVPGWEGFKVALKATMKYYFLHNVAWYCDPDVMLLRQPLSIEQARAWATLQGLTGQALLASDRMMDLSNERVEIAKRVFPAVDIRPFDLFPSERNKRIWDLKVNHLDRSYDVVSVFNYSDKNSDYVYIKWTDLGLISNTPIHIYDFWNKEYLGAWEDGISIDLAPTSCRVLTLIPSNENIQLISTSRHITQGWIDIKKIQFDQKKNIFSGESTCIKSDPYELRFVFPKGKNFKIKNATANGLSIEIRNYQGWATIGFTPKKSADVRWQIEFESSDFYRYPVSKPDVLNIEPMGIDGVTVQWDAQYYLNAGYEVYLDGKHLGYTQGTSFGINSVNPHIRHSVAVHSVWEDGTMSKDKAEKQFTLDSLLRNEYNLTELESIRATCGWGTIGNNRSISGTSLSIAGKQFANGIGTHALSVIEYDLRGMFSEFNALVGVDDGSSEKGSIKFIIEADGKELWRSGVMKKSDAPKPVNLSIKGINRFILRVTDAGDGIDYDHADWCDAKVKR